MRFILLVLVSCASLAFAHESCCNKKAQGEPELIPDPEDPWTEMIEDLTVTAPPGGALQSIPSSVVHCVQQLSVCSHHSRLTHCACAAFSDVTVSL